MDIIHDDPTTREWQDLPTKDAPPWWAKAEEAFKRKDLRKNHGVFALLTRAQMKEIWRRE